MIFHSHNKTPDIDVNFTSLQGYVTAKYDVLCALFGEPLDGDGRKTDAEWHFVFVPSGEVATLYNWKNGRNYLGKDGLNVEDITEWNIGGHSSQVVAHIQAAISNYIPETT